MLEKMNKVLSVDKEARQIKVQAQMTLKGFYDTADAAHLSIPVEALPWWQGLTLGGVFATSSHGTGNNATHMIVSACAARHSMPPSLTLSCMATHTPPWKISSSRQWWWWCGVLTPRQKRPQQPTCTVLLAWPPEHTCCPSLAVLPACSATGLSTSPGLTRAATSTSARRAVRRRLRCVEAWA